MSALPAQTVQSLSRHWIGRLSAYRQHRHDEHREALIVEAMRFVGLRLESDLDRSSYWRDKPLVRRAAVLLYLVDRGAVARSYRNGRVVYEATDGAETWVAAQTSLVPYLAPTLDLVAALRNEQMRRLPSAD